MNNNDERHYFEDFAWLFSCTNDNRKIVRLNFDEAALLWKTVKATSGPILEIGRRRGGSTTLICAAAENRRVISIDCNPEHHKRCQRFFERPEIQEKLELIVADSKVPLDSIEIGMLFIDGDHSYEGVRGDTLAHWPALRSFSGNPGLAIYHDAASSEAPHATHTCNPNVNKLCQELIECGAGKLLWQAGSMLVLQKLLELPEGF